MSQEILCYALQRVKPMRQSATYRRTALSSLKLNLPKAACAAFFSTMTLFALPPPALTPPSVSKSFNPSTITAGATSTLSFTVTNPNAGASLTGVTLLDTFPANLVLAATGTQTASCTGVGSVFGGVAATLGGTTVGLNSTVIGPSGSCSFSVLVQGTTAGLLTNNVTASDIIQGAGNPGTANLQVNAPLPPVLSKAFGTATVGLNGTTTVTLTIMNPNPTVPLPFSVADLLPPGLIFSLPNGLINTCGGTFVMATNRLEFDLNATLAPGATCNLTVNVTGTIDGPATNQSLALSTAGFSNTATATVFVGDPFQVRYTSNLAIGDSVINFTNTGEGLPRAPIPSAPIAAAPVQADSLCVNVYAFSPDEQLVSCCSCLVTPNGLGSLSAVSDLTSNTLTPGRPTSIVVKLLATTGTGATTVCNAATAGTPANPLTNGLAAWGTTIHPLPVTAGSPAGTFGITETRFVSARLSAAELTRITTLCGFIQITGSGFGICKSCRLGGLGGEKQ